MENIELKIHLKNLEKKLFVIYGIGLLVLIFLAIISNFLLKDQAARQATSLIRRTVERGDYRETIYTLNDAKLDYFDAVIYYDENGKRLFSLPSQLDLNFANQVHFVSQLLYSRLKIDLFFDAKNEQKIGSVLFVFGRLSHVPYAIFIWFFFLAGTFPLVRQSRLKTIEEYNRQVLLREETSRADLARRVRHDIRSPLGALLIATHNLEGMNPKQRTIIQRATERIGEIVGELELIRVQKINEQPNVEGPFVELCSVLSLTQDILQEKRAQLIGERYVQLVSDFSADAFFLFAQVNSSDFKRALSNIIDNAIEASKSGARICIRLASEASFAIIEIVDNGRGISKDNLNLVTQKGFTSKRTGNGLGLYYADKTVSEAHGTLTIKSELSEGTSVSIRLPRSEPPRWYVPKVQVPNGGLVVILDDQDSTHLSWKMRLDELKTQGAHFEVMSFKTPLDFIRWHKSVGSTMTMPVLYLFDYDLGEGQRSGLQVAVDCGLNGNVLLVTGHFDSEDIQHQCVQQRIGLLPKSYLSEIQIQAV